MARIAAKYNCVVIAMHNQDSKIYEEDIILSMKKFFKKTFEIAEKNGLNPNKIIIDPGVGFGKGYDENIEDYLTGVSRIDASDYKCPKNRQN